MRWWARGMRGFIGSVDSCLGWDFIICLSVRLESNSLCHQRSSKALRKSNFSSLTDFPIRSVDGRESISDNTLQIRVISDTRKLLPRKLKLIATAFRNKLSMTPNEFVGELIVRAISESRFFSFDDSTCCCGS